MYKAVLEFGNVITWCVAMGCFLVLWHVNWGEGNVEHVISQLPQSPWLQLSPSWETNQSQDFPRGYSRNWYADSGWWGDHELWHYNISGERRGEQSGASSLALSSYRSRWLAGTLVARGLEAFWRETQNCFDIRNSDLRFTSDYPTGLVETQSEALPPSPPHVITKWTFRSFGKKKQYLYYPCSMNQFNSNTRWYILYRTNEF